MNTLKNKIAVVTGASSGIGAATAKAFSELGATMVILYRHNSSGADGVLKVARKHSPKSIKITADLSDEDEVKKVFQSIVAKFGHIDILINNAGETNPTNILESCKSDWQKAFDSNFYSAVLCTKNAAEIMIKQKQGKILITSSVRGLEDSGRAGIFAYSAAKAALNNFLKTMAKELAPYNIQVNGIAPGFVFTPNYKQFSEELQNKFIESTYIKRFIQPEEIADGFIFLAQNDSITGQVIVMDGGFTLNKD